MPNIRSAKKRVKVISKKTERNKAIRSALKTTIKKATVSIDSASEDRIEAVREAMKRIDQASSKGILHKNTAARKKAALARRLNSVNV